MADELRARVEELERQMACVVRNANPFSNSYPTLADYHRDLTTPPPKPRPKIEVLVMGTRYCVACDGHYWHGDVWGDYVFSSYSKYDAHAIAAALIAAGNYPAEYQETSR